MKVSVLCPISRYGGLDILENAFEMQDFPKEDYELILCDKLYKSRKHIVEDWSAKTGINVNHFEPKNKSEYHVHSSILNECLARAQGACSIVIGDYTFMNPGWMDRHYKYYMNGLSVTAPQVIYGLPKLKENLKQCRSVFENDFSTDMFKILPTFLMDPKLSLGNVPVSHQFCYNRNESFPTAKALQIGGWDESYDETVGPNNKEFYLRLIQETGCKFVNEPQNTIYRIMSYPIPPFVKFRAKETDDTLNMSKYKALCKKYNVGE